MHLRSCLSIAARAGLCLLLGACGGEAFRPQGGSFQEPSSIPVTTAACTVARSSEPLVPRVDLTGMNASTVGGQGVAYTSDLAGAFYSFCGGCHVDGAQGEPFFQSDSWCAPNQYCRLNSGPVSACQSFS